MYICTEVCVKRDNFLCNIIRKFKVFLYFYVVYVTVFNLTIIRSCRLLPLPLLTNMYFNIEEELG